MAAQWHIITVRLNVVMAPAGDVVADTGMSGKKIA